MFPEVGFNNFAINLIVVVFPAPFGPTNPMVSPSETSKLRLFTAVNFPYFFVKFSNFNTTFP